MCGKNWFRNKAPRKVKDYLEDDMFNRLLKCFELSKFHEYREYMITELIFDTGIWKQ